MLGFKGGWPEIAISRDRRNVQSTNTRPPSKIADTFYFTNRAPLCEWCADSVLSSPKPSFPRHEHRLRDSPSKKSVQDQAVEGGSSWKYRSVDWKRFNHGKFRRGLDCISKEQFRHQSRHEFLRNQIWRNERFDDKYDCHRIERQCVQLFKGWEIWKRKWEKIEVNNIRFSLFFFLKRN